MNPEFILNFHGVGVAPRPFDPGEKPYWITEAFFARIVEMVAPDVRAGRGALTFDDGNASDAEIALPILKDAGIGATFFVLAGRLGIPGFLRPDHVAALEDAGMTIGSHGFDHVDWRRLDAAGRRREFVEARERIRGICAGPVTAAAIPFGAYDRGVLSGLKAAGYAAIYTSDGGPAGRGPVFARSSVRDDMTVETVEAIRSGRESLARRLRRRAAILRKRLF